MIAASFDWRNRITWIHVGALLARQGTACGYGTHSGTADVLVPRSGLQRARTLIRRDRRVRHYAIGLQAGEWPPPVSGGPGWCSVALRSPWSPLSAISTGDPTLQRLLTRIARPAAGWSLPYVCRLRYRRRAYLEQVSAARTVQRVGYEVAITPARDAYGPPDADTILFQFLADGSESLMVGPTMPAPGSSPSPPRKRSKRARAASPP